MALLTKRKISIAAVLVCIAAAAYYFSDFPSATNPEYDGHTMNYWIKHTDYVPLVDLNMHGEGGWPTREKAFDALAKIGAPAVPALTQILLNKALKPDRRWKCAESLGAIGPPAMPAAAALALCLSDPTFPEMQRYELIMALEKIGASADQAPALIEYLKQRHAQSPSSPSLIYDLDKLEAIKALGKAGTAAKPGVPLLIGMLRDYQKIAKDLAADVHPKSQSDQERALEDGETLRAALVETMGILAALEPQALPAIDDASADPSAKVRVQAARAYIGIGKLATALPLLETIANDKNVFVRWEVVEALEVIGAKDRRMPVPLLTKLLKDPHEETRWRAADALGNIGPPAASALPELKACLKDTSDRVRTAAKEAIARIEC